MFKQKLKILGVLPILSILLLLGFATPSKAAQFENTDTYTLEETEIVEENLYVNAKLIDIAGVVDGDLFVGGDTVTISGTVTGDLYIAASTIEVSGNIYGSTYLGGTTIDLSGSTARNAVVAGVSVEVTGSVGRDLTVYAGRSTISGKVTEDIRVFASKSSVSGTVKGEALIFARNSTLNKEQVEGEVYENIEKGEISESLTNSFTHTMPKFNMGRGFRQSLYGVNILATLIGFVAMYIVGVVLIYLAPIKTLKIEKKVIGSAQDFLFSFLIGLGIVFLIPVPLLILMFSAIGTPLAILITGALLFATIFGTLWVESAVGYRILSETDRKDPKRLISLLVGRGITTIVNFIPILRGLYRSVLSMVALGAIVRMKYDAYKGSRKKK